MPTRFRKSLKIAPGVRLNIGKKSGSISVGKRGASMNFGKRGVYGNIGIPGSGLSYRSKLVGSSQINQTKAVHQNQAGSANKVTVGVQISLLNDGSITFKDEKGNFLPDEWVRKAKTQNKEIILDWLSQHCDDKNEEIDSLLTIHLSTPPPDTKISYTPVEFEVKKPIPPKNTFIAIKPDFPKLKEYGFLAKIIDLFRKRIDKRNSKIQEKYQDALDKWHIAKEKYEAEYDIKYQEYLGKLDEFNQMLDVFEGEQEERKKFVEQDRLNNVDAMQRFLEEVLQTIIWPKETEISFEILNEGTEVLMDVDLPEIEDMPEMYTKVNKRDYRLTFAPFSNTQQRKNYITHIHSIGFRLIGEVFVSLPTVTKVVFSGYSLRVSKSTGRLENEYLYSAKVDRKKWEEINFNNLDKIDVVSCFEEFDLRRNATSTGIIRVIDPF